VNTISSLADGRVKTNDKIKSINPAKPSEVVGIFQKAGTEHVEPAMQAALTAFESWKRSSLEQRVDLLVQTARSSATASFEFCAWLVLKSRRTG
jgi:1-pyrroline-5-carboxylate dehydrogenase